MDAATCQRSLQAFTDGANLAPESGVHHLMNITGSPVD
jgi:hypothetical protein